MTAKHRGKKNKNTHEDFNNVNHESSELDARGGKQYTLLLISFLMIVFGGATAAWFCFQQHQSITYLADNLVGMQMKMVKLQSFQEEIIQTNEKQLRTDDFEHRLNTLEESYTLAQKQVGMALAMAEQLKTSDLPSQVLSLHTEMKARLEEMQQGTVSADQLTQLQAMLKGKSEEFEAVRLQVEGLARVSTGLAESVEGLTGSLMEAESKLEERAWLVGTLSATLEGQTSELLGLKEQLAANQAQLEASTAEIASVKELMETGQSQRAQQVEQSLQEQNSAAYSLHSELRAQLEAVQKSVAQLEGGIQAGEPSEEVEEETVPDAAEEVEEAAPAEEDPEEEEEEEEEVVEEEAAHLDGEPVDQEDSAVTEEQTAPAEEMVEAEENVEKQAEDEDSEAEEEQEEKQALEEEEEQREEDDASPEQEL